MTVVASPFPQIDVPSPQALSQVLVNEALASLGHAAVYGYAYQTSSGLTWGYYGGRWGGFSVAAGTLSLTLSTTNYIVVANATGAISVSTSSTNWDDANYARVYKVVTGATTVTSAEDHRAGPGGAHGGSGGGPAFLSFEYDGVSAYVQTARKLFVRRVGDPDPTADMDDGDLLIDISSDTTPGAFSFAAYVGALPGFVYTSESDALSGLTGTPAVTVTGGDWRKSSDSGATWTTWGTSSGVASDGDLVQVRGTSNAAAAGTTTVSLTVGGVTEDYVITTLATLEEFTGGAGAYAGGALFDIYDAGGGATTLDGSGAMVQTCTSTAHGAHALRKAVFSDAAVKKYRRHFRNAAVGGSTVLLALQRNVNSNKSQLAPTINATWGGNNSNIVWMGDNGGVNYRNASDVTVSYNHSTNAWGSSSVYSLSLSTDYVAEIESDGSQFRCAWYDTNDVLLKQTPWIAWSAALARNSFTYIGFGDYLTDFGTVTSSTKTYGES